MRTSRRFLGTLAASMAVAGLLVVGCSSDNNNGGTGGAGGTAGSGGAAGSGGSAGTGGTAGSGGTAGTGGTAGSGGTAGMDGGGGTAGAGGTAGMDGGAGTGGTGGAPVDAGPTMTVSGIVTDSNTQAAVANAQVCVTFPKLAPKPCTNTDTSGQYSLAGVPQQRDVTISYDATGYIPADVYTHTGTADLTIPLNMLSTTAATAFATLLGKQLDPTKGVIFAVANTMVDGGVGRFSGASFALSPTSGDGPYYVDATGKPNTSLTSTSVAGLAAFLNTDPGSYDMSVTTTNCAGPNSGWSPAANKVSLKTTAGRASVVAFFCQ